MSLLVWDRAYVQETAAVKLVAFWNATLFWYFSWKENVCMTAWIGPAILTFSNGWLEDVLKKILLDSGRWNKGNKEQRKTLWVLHLSPEAGPYLNAAFWFYCGTFNLRRKRLSTKGISCSVICSYFQLDPSQEFWMTAWCRATLQQKI